MFLYILKRLLVMIPTLLGITFITFLIVRLAPGDPVASQFGQGGGGKTAGAEGGGAANVKNDAIRAKKELLGMMTKEFAVITWDAARGARARDYQPTDKYKTWDDFVKTGSIGELPDWARSMAVSPDESTFYLGDSDGNLRALDRATGELGAEFAAHDGEIWSIAITPDGTRLVSADVNGRISIHDTSSGQTVTPDVVIPDVVIHKVNIHPDGDSFASGSSDGIIRLHDMATGEVQAELQGHIAYVSDVVYSPDGSTLYSGGNDGRIRAWDVAERRQISELGQTGQAARDLELSDDGERLFVASNDNAVWIFTTDGSAEPAELKGHARPVVALALHPDQRTLFSGSEDESIRSWDLETAESTSVTPENTGALYQLEVSSDGTQLWSVGESWRPTSVPTQYMNWLGKLVRLDFGNSFIYPDEKVIDLIAERVPVTLGLNGIGLLLIYTVAIPLGVIAAVKRNTFFDNATSLVLFLLWSMPSFWVATLLIIYFSSERNFNWFASVGLHDPNHRDMPYLTYLADWANHLVLPVIASVYSGFTVLSRFARTSLLESISQDFVRTARAKGLSERVVVFKHALRNSLITIITLLGNLLPGLIGGSVIIEVIFSIEGMGELGFQAILERDYPVIMAVTTIGAVLTLLGILLSDILYSLADPRITTK